MCDALNTNCTTHCPSRLKNLDIKFMKNACFHLNRLSVVFGRDRFEICHSQMWEWPFLVCKIDFAFTGHRLQKVMVIESKHLFDIFFQPLSWKRVTFSHKHWNIESFRSLFVWFVFQKKSSHLQILIRIRDNLIISEMYHWHSSMLVSLHWKWNILSHSHARLQAKKPVNWTRARKR